MEDVRPVREYPKSVELKRFGTSWRPVDWYRLASHPVRGKLQLWTIDAPERERPVGTRSLLGSAPVNSVRRRLRPSECVRHDCREGTAATCIGITKKATCHRWALHELGQTSGTDEVCSVDGSAPRMSSPVVLWMYRHLYCSDVLGQQLVRRSNGRIVWEWMPTRYVLLPDDP